MGYRGVEREQLERALDRAMETLVDVEAILGVAHAG